MATYTPGPKHAQPPVFNTAVMKRCRRFEAT